LLSPTPETSFEPAAPWQPRPAPGGPELVAGELWRRATLPITALRAIGQATSHPVAALEALWGGAAGLVEVFGKAGTPASPTPLNPPQIGPHRRFDWTRFDLGRVKAVKQALGGTVNDVVLATVVGALRRYLRARGVVPENLDFRAMIPVSVRAAGERGALGNRVAQILAPLPLGEPDPRRRLERV